MVLTVINIHLSTWPSVSDTPLTALCRFTALKMPGALLFYWSRWNIETYTFIFSLRYCTNYIIENVMNALLLLLWTHYIFLFLCLLQLRLKTATSIHSKVCVLLLCIWDIVSGKAHCTGTEALLNFMFWSFEPRK